MLEGGQFSLCLINNLTLTVMTQGELRYVDLTQTIHNTKVSNIYVISTYRTKCQQAYAVSLYNIFILNCNKFTKLNFSLS